MRHILAKVAVSLLIGGMVLFVGAPAGAWEVPGDFITGGGWFIMQNPYFPAIQFAVPGGRANFGWHGGVKNGGWWGNGNYIDHGSGFHIHNVQVTGYVKVVDYAPDKNGHPRGTRDICGTATVAGFGEFFYRVRMRDLGEPGAGNAGGNDAFGITLYSETTGDPVYFAQGVPINGGNIQLHKGNPSNIPPTTPPSCDSPPFSNILFTFQ